MPFRTSTHGHFFFSFFRKKRGPCVGVSRQSRVHCIQAHKRMVMYSMLSFFFSLHSDKNDSHVHMLTRSLADAFAVTSLPELRSVYKMHASVHEVLSFPCTYTRVCVCVSSMHARVRKLYLCVSLTMRVYSRVLSSDVWMEIECVRAKRLVRSWSSRDVLARNGKRERVKEKERIVIQDDGRERFCGETFDVCTFRKLTDRLSFLPSAVFFLEFFRFFFPFARFFHSCLLYKWCT